MAARPEDAEGVSWYESSARQRLDLLLDAGSFVEFVPPTERESCRELCGIFAACLCNLFVCGPANPLFKINEPRRYECGMSVGIYESRQHNLLLTIDLDDLLPVPFDPGISQSLFRLAHRDNFPGRA